MGAPKGNQFYLLRSKDGRDKIYDKPQDLIDACNQYFQWCLDNPLKEEEVFHSQGVITKASINKLRPFTLEGLCNFLDISVKGFKLYENRKDFIPVTTRVREIIYNQKFEGASAGFFNANIIARDLGLSDKKQLSGDSENPLVVVSGMEIS